MGWSGANNTFDDVARFVLNSSMGPKEQQRLLALLIEKLQQDDWDTEDESLELFREYPQIVAAFEENNVFPYDDPRNDY